MLKASDFDTETLKLMTNWGGSTLFTRRTVEVNTFSERGDEEWSIPAFKALVLDAIASIPPECLASAKACLAEESGTLKVIYARPETDAEYDARIDRALQYAREVQRKERVAFERLKAKFEKDTPHG